MGVKEPGLRHLLRSATKADHERVDAIFSAFPLEEASGYTAFLEAQASAVVALEEAIDARMTPEHVGDWPARRRTGAILQDLARLGGTLRSLPAPRIASAGEAIGALYVLEGSRLGGRLLLDRVLAAPHAEDHGATSFLRHGYRERYWQSFLAALDGSAFDAPAADGMIAAAQRAFELFELSGRRVLSRAASEGRGIPAAIGEAAGQSEVMA